MSIWAKIGETLSAIGDSIGNFLATLSRKSSAPEKSLGFTIGMIALGAKMARADGVVTRDEVAAFKQVFQVPDKDTPAVERVFNLAKEDVAGFDSYARQVAKLFSKKAAILENVLDGLFHIAKADGAVHEDEIEYLKQVADIFGFDAQDFARISARHVRYDDNPYEVLGLERTSSMSEIRTRYRKLVRDLHPDKQIAAGVPAEMVKLATERMARINSAYTQLTKGAA